MAHKITIRSNSMEDALNKARRFLYADNVEQIDYEIVENDGEHVVIMCCLKDLDGGNDNHNGYFKIFYRDRFAYLVVYPPMGSGRPVYEDDVTNRMKLLNIPPVSSLYIRDIIDRARQIPEKLTEWPMGAEFRANISITVSDDKMTAVVNIQPPKRGGATVTADEIIFAIEDYGIRYGVDHAVIAHIAEQKMYNKDVCIANGLRVVPPVANRINYYFDTDVRRPFLTDEYGNVNLKELNFIQEKKKGERLADLAEQQPGKDGIDVFGVTVPVGQIEQNVRLSGGANTILSEDGLSLSAAIDGYVEYRNGIISIQDVVHVENVDYSTGNIDYDGAVVVAGTVADGFSVKATGTIQIGSSVGKVHLESGADIVLKAGINGNGEGHIQCKGNLYTRFAENVNIRADGSVYAEESIMNSITETDGNLILVGRRAEIVGGRTVVGGHIRCKKIGSAAGIRTEISVGILPDKYRTIANLSSRIASNRDMLAKLQISMNNLVRDQKKQSDEAEFEKQKNKILTLQFRFEDELREMERDYIDGKNMLQAENNRYIVAENQICQGTIINFGKVEYPVKTTDLSRIILRYMNERVTESGFDKDNLPDVFSEQKESL